MKKILYRVIPYLIICMLLVSSAGIYALASSTSNTVSSPRIVSSDADAQTVREEFILFVGETLTLSDSPVPAQLGDITIVSSDPGVVTGAAVSGNFGHIDLAIQAKVPGTATVTVSYLKEQTALPYAIYDVTVAEAPGAMLMAVPAALPIPTISKTVEIQWTADGGTRPAGSVMVQLYRNIPGGDLEAVGGAFPLSATSWSTIRENLDTEDGDGNPYTYTVVPTVPEGFSLQKIRYQDDRITIFLQMKNDTDTKVVVTKYWDDGDDVSGRPDSIAFEFRDDSGKTNPNCQGTITGNKTDSIWTEEFEFKGNQKDDYTVLVEPNPPSGYTATIDQITRTITNYKPVPALTITKTITNAPKDATLGYQVGETITYVITVKNTGNTDLVDIQIDDSLFSTLVKRTVSLPRNSEALRIEYSHTVTEADLGTGTWHNIATATVTPSQTGSKIEGSDFADAEIADKNPKLEVTKTVANTPPRGYFIVGESIEYAVTVENKGDVTLTNVVVSDAMMPKGSETIDSIGVGVTKKLSVYAHTVVPGDLGKPDNKLPNTVTATADKIGAVAATHTATAYAVVEPPKTIDYTVTIVWQSDYRNANNTRPSQITVNLRDDNNDPIQTIVLNAANGWQVIVLNLPAGKYHVDIPSTPPNGYRSGRVTTTADSTTIRYILNTSAPTPTPTPTVTATPTPTTTDATLTIFDDTIPLGGGGGSNLGECFE